jgi:hypothetical protein
MSQYSRPRPEPFPAKDLKICAHCGRPVSPDDRFCSGCGVEFGGPPRRVDHDTKLPGFQYHLVQGLGWGLGFLLAGVVVAVFLTLLSGVFVLAFRARWGI